MSGTDDVTDMRGSDLWVITARVVRSQPGTLVLLKERAVGWACTDVGGSRRVPTGQGSVGSAGRAHAGVVACRRVGCRALRVCVARSLQCAVA